MALALLLFAALSLPQPDHPNWLVGTWIWADEGREPDYAECTGPLAITYGVNGTYSMRAELGTWRLQGERLTEVSTKVDRREWGNAAPPVGVPYRSRLARLNADSFRKVYKRGSPAVFYRCPAGAR